jgi:hypothetical protein
MTSNKMEDLPPPEEKDRLSREVTKYDLRHAAIVIFIFLPIMGIGTLVFNIPQGSMAAIGGVIAICAAIIERRIRKKLLAKKNEAAKNEKT